MTSSFQFYFDEKTCAYADTMCEVQAPTALSRGDPFTRQIGQVLLVLGEVFINVHPFSDLIDRNTGQLLISLGRKLKKM